MEILRVDERKANLQNLKQTLENFVIETANNHCCGNCGRTSWNKSVLLCNFTKKETNPNDHCVHYI